MAAQGRPQAIDPDAIIAIDGASARTMLQAASEPRAIILKLVDFGGRATARELDDHFLYDTSAKLRMLLRAGWISIHEAGTLRLPRRARS